MAEHNDDGLLREIKEELRQEQFTKIFTTYGKYVIVVAILIVASVGGYKWWQANEQSKRADMTAIYLDAVQQAADGDSEMSLKNLDTVRNVNIGATGIIATMRKAAELAKSGDTDGAAKLYRTVGGSTDAPAIYRDLASVYLATLQLNGGDYDAARKTAKPITVDKNAWRYAALEVVALADLESGDVESARKNFSAIADANLAPQNLRQRASILLKTLPAAKEQS